MPPLRLGVLGFGMIGKVHVYAYHNMHLYYDPPPVQTRLVGVCTGHTETAEAARELMGFEFATTDWREITQNPKIDIVNICTPNHLHRDQLLSAMANGKHIYCDKPLTATVHEARDVEAALDKYRATHQMTFNYRFLPATLRAKQLIDQGFLGDPLCFRAVYLHSGSADPQAPLKWKLSAKAGGGVIHDLGSHVIDLMRHYLGEFGEIACATKIAYDTRPAIDDPSRRVPVEAEDHAVMMVRTRGGAFGTIEASKIATGTEDELRFEIHGTRGGLRFDLMQPSWLEAFEAGVSEKPLGGERGWKRIATVHRYEPPAGWPGPKMPGGWMRAHVAGLYNFLDAIATGRKAEPGLETGVRVQEIMDAAHRSAREGGWVEV